MQPKEPTPASNLKRGEANRTKRPIKFFTMIMEFMGYPAQERYQLVQMESMFMMEISHQT
jgi:hypothetical protein